MIIDVICYYILMIILAVIFDLVGLGIDFNNTLMVYAFGLPVHFLYHSSLETVFGKTVGKMITKTRVVDEGGDKINFSEAAVRSLCRFIPFEAFTFLGSGLGLHDRLSKTRVING